MAVWLNVIMLLFAGFLLLLFELFIIPGFGIVGVAGFILIAIGSYMSFTDLSVAAGFAVSIISFVTVVLFVRFFSRKLSGSISLRQKEDRARGFTASEDYSELLGKRGVAATILRPGGEVLIEGRKVSAVTEGMLLEKGDIVKVCKVEGNMIFVKLADKKTD